MFVRFLFAMSVLVLTGCASAPVPMGLGEEASSGGGPSIEVPEIAILPLQLQVSEEMTAEIGAVRISNRNRYVLLTPSRSFGGGGMTISEHWISEPADAAHIYLGDLDGDGVREILIQETGMNRSTYRMLSGRLTGDEHWPFFWRSAMFGDEVAQRVIPDMEFVITLRAEIDE